MIIQIIRELSKLSVININNFELAPLAPNSEMQLNGTLSTQKESSNATSHHSRVVNINRKSCFSTQQVSISTSNIRIKSYSTLYFTECVTQTNCSY